MVIVEILIYYEAKIDYPFSQIKIEIILMTIYNTIFDIFMRHGLLPFSISRFLLNFYVPRRIFVFKQLFLYIFHPIVLTPFFRVMKKIKHEYCARLVSYSKRFKGWMLYKFDLWLDAAYGLKDKQECKFIFYHDPYSK